ncbi:hypothetical protein P4O66_018900 [Electrophorus voltai]|uniref:Uncharacterized protein n=1 Tax=Electrophorus voltai TaxID=2609070 RepID=A0AAD9DKX0_9TELE|nr:hypothetical protein P4O66_018900 [Electrophorus voltai]
MVWTYLESPRNTGTLGRSRQKAQLLPPTGHMTWPYTSTQAPVSLEPAYSPFLGPNVRNTDLPRMPGKGKKKKGRKGSQRPPTARAANSPMFLGTLLTPSAGPCAEAGESYRTTAGGWDWYNDFQSSESDSVDSYCPAERTSLILALLQGTTRREDPAERFSGDPVYGPGSDIPESYGDQPDHENRHSEMDSAGS